MDSIKHAIATFAANLTYDDLPSSVVGAATRRTCDGIGCALGADDAEPVAVARNLAKDYPGGTGVAGRMIGAHRGGTPPDMAAFVNTTMIRYLDYNDWTPNGHPSDLLGPLVAFGDHPRVSGPQLLTSLVVAYEVLIRLTEEGRFQQRGWDQGFASGVATAAAIGNLLGMDVATIGHAVSIMASSGVPIGSTRTGQLSMWKACATAFAGRNAALVTLLARNGLTGPPEPFEGDRGIWQLITGPFDFIPPTPGVPADFRILRTALKHLPVCYHAQAPVWAALELRERLDPTEIASLEVATYAEAWKSIGRDPQRWDPRSRETADHSMPYLVSRALVDGAVSASWFEPAAYLAADLRPLMNRVSVVSGQHEDAVYPAQIVARLTATDHAGDTHEVTVVNPSGHPDRPMTDDDIHEKFSSLASVALEDDRIGAALDAWCDIRNLEQLTPALDLLVPGPLPVWRPAPKRVSPDDAGRDGYGQVQRQQVQDS